MLSTAAQDLVTTVPVGVAVSADGSDSHVGGGVWSFRVAGLRVTQLGLWDVIPQKPFWLTSS